MEYKSEIDNLRDVMRGLNIRLTPSEYVCTLSDPALRRILWPLAGQFGIPAIDDQAVPTFRRWLSINPVTRWYGDK